jgi:hypothetical protein
MKGLMWIGSHLEGRPVIKRAAGKTLVAAIVPIVLSCAGCLEDDPVSFDAPYSVLYVDSASVHAEPGLHPYSGETGYRFVFDIYYELGGNPGAIFNVEIFPYPPARYYYGIQYNQIFRNDPLPADVKHVLSDDIWIDYDYADHDSIWIYLSVEARFWRDFEVEEIGLSERDLRGEDRCLRSMKIDIRGE